MRIQIITHAALSPTVGAGQVALNLAAGLGDLGHEAIVQSVAAAPAGLPWWRQRQAMRARVDALAAAGGPFDIIDCPETLVTRGLGRFAPRIVARSVQPSLLYLAHELRHSWHGGPRGAARALMSAWDGLVSTRHALSGWQRATCILSLGLREREWMSDRFPSWRRKLYYYVNAPSPRDQEALAAVRRGRGRAIPSRRRFLWVGRWSAHKGTHELVAFVRAWAKSFPDDTFTIAGCGNEATRECPPELVRSGQLTMVPSFERAGLLPLLAGHDAGLFTSRVEGWGLVLNEMLESGLTVFATPAGATRDLQPFFPAALKPFPPDPGWRPPPESFAPPDEYYSTFNWRTIAREYVEKVAGGPGAAS